MIKEKAYAKVNLTLNVGPSINGYHELESIMVPVDLYDILEFEENDLNKMCLFGSTVEDDIILKTANIFKEKYLTKGANIYLKKNIPMEAGMAGGSADSSATLRGLNRLFNLNLSLEELDEIARMMGSDTSFTLYNHSAICTGRGEKLEFFDFEKKYPILLLKPKYGISTKKCFEKCNPKVLKNSTVMRNNLILGNDVSSYYTNDLLDAAIQIEPKLLDDLKYVESFGYRVNMSGSGSTLYVIGEVLDTFCQKNDVKNRFDFIYLTQILSRVE